MRQLTRFCSILIGWVLLQAMVEQTVSAKSPQEQFFQTPATTAQIEDDEFPIPTDPATQGTGEFAEQTPDSSSLVPPSPSASVPGLSPLGPSGGLNSAGLTGLTASLGTTAGAFSAAPNMIGDLFNAGTSSLNFQAAFEVTPNFASTGPNSGFVVPNASALVAGVNAPINGVQVTSLSNIGDIVRVGDSSFISVSDLSPINSVNIQVNNSTEASNVLSGGSSQPLAPTSNSSIFQAANRAIADEFSTGFSSDVNVEELVRLEYLEGESVIRSVGTDEVLVSYVYNASVALPVPSPGEVVGRYSIADNNSPLPQNRLFLDYNFFHNARITAAGIPVNRWAPGFESTFADGLGSIEFRAPMAVTLTSAISTSGDDLAAFEFGDISFALKGLLHQDDRVVLSAGLGVTIPTADDFSLTLEDNAEVVRIENQAVHFLPFIAGSLNVTPNTFVQSFTQFDFDASGNEVFLNEQGFLLQGAGELANAGRLRSQSTVRFSNSAGCFLIRGSQRRVSDLAAVLETHYTATLNRSDAVGSTNFSVGDPTQTLSVLNLTSGLHAYIGKSVVTAAYGVPVTEDRVFDGELRVFVNRYF